MSLNSKDKLIDIYLDTQLEYQAQYGPRTIVLMEVGSFYELYAVSESEYDNLRELSTLVNIRVTRKNTKSGDTVSKSNPYMAGVTSIALSKYVKLMVEGGYTVVQIDQVTPPPNPSREVVKIHSPGTYEAEEDFSISGDNYLLSLYIEGYELTGDKQVYSIAGTLFDLTTGQTFTFECHDSPTSNSVEALSEAYRIIYGYGPVETLIHTHNLKTPHGELILRLGLKRDTVHMFSEPDEKWFDISYQDEFLQRHFSPPGSVQPADHIGLSTLNHSLISFVLGVKFSYDHDKEIVQHLLRPKILCTDDDLSVSYHALETLDVVNRRGTENGKYSSLFGILNCCITAPGRRLLRTRLLNPTANISELESRYDLLTEIGKMDIQGGLKLCYDLQRLHRRMGLGRLSLYEFTNLDQTYQNLNDILSEINRNPTAKSIIYQGDSNTNRLAEFSKFQEDYRKQVNMQKLLQYGQISDIDTNIFNTGVYLELDKLDNGIKNSFRKLNILKSCICRLTSDGLTSNTDIDSLVKLEKTEKDGYYFRMTKNRSRHLKKNIADGNIINKYIPSENSLVDGDNTRLFSQLKFKERTSDTNLSSGWIENMSNSININCTKLRSASASQFSILQKTWYHESQYLLDWLAESLAKIDLAWSSYRVAQKRNYCRPKLNQRPSSCLVAKELRHPITEVVRSEIVFVPNPVSIGNQGVDKNDKCGVVITGLNGVGKSIYIKSVALAVLMAQSGLFVAANECELSPYTRLFTRIGNCDNLFRGQSTFFCEMLELEGILRNADKKSLVIADELCSGSEQASAQAILAGTIIKLSELGTNFFLTTHMHKVLELPEIQEQDKIILQHFKVDYEEGSGEIVYDRRLMDGIGPKLYGIEVANHIIADSQFIHTCHNLRKRFLGIQTESNSVHPSKYNSTVIVEKCEVCGKNPSYKGELHTHHIAEQANANDSGFIGHIPKNIKGNLVVLCCKHHEMVHHGGLLVRGWKQSTSKGRFLDFEFVKKDTPFIEEEIQSVQNKTYIQQTKKKKYTKEQVIKVNDVWKSVDEKVRRTKQLLESKHGYKKISEVTIRKMTRGLY